MERIPQNFKVDFATKSFIENSKNLGFKSKSQFIRKSISCLFHLLRDPDIRYHFMQCRAYNFESEEHFLRSSCLLMMEELKTLTSDSES